MYPADESIANDIVNKEAEVIMNNMLKEAQSIELDSIPAEEQKSIAERLQEAQAELRKLGVNLNLRASRLGIQINPKKYVNNVKNAVEYKLGEMKVANMQAIDKLTEFTDQKIQTIFNNIFTNLNTQINEAVQDQDLKRSLLAVSASIQQQAQSQAETRHLIESPTETIGDKLDAAVSKVISDSKAQVRDSPAVQD